MKRSLIRSSVRAIALVLGLVVYSNAWAAVPTATVVWESDFGTATKTGTDGNSYTIELNDNTVTDGNIVIASGASKGAIVNTSAAEASSMTVLIRYKSAPTTSASVVPASIYCYRTSGSIPDVGMVTYRGESYYNHPCWYVSSSSKSFDSDNAQDPVMTASGGYLMLSYDCATLKVYAGTSIGTLAGRTIAYSWPSSKMNYVGLGGQTGKASGCPWNAWGGMVIDKVAIFIGSAYTNTDFAEFKWPSETKAELSTWLDDGRSVLAWRASASGTGNFHESALSAVNSDGSMSAPVAMNASGGVGYTSFIYGNNNYTKPGWVLYYDASSYKQSSNSTFSELSLGGMCVTAEASDGNPYTITGSGDRGVNLGHPEYTTYFRFDKSFTFNRALDRTEQTEFKGIVNVTVAEDAVFDVNSAQKEATYPHNCALASGATLVMAGEGQMKLGILNATGGTLDFSKLSTSRETPFIDGTVQLAADTAIKLPAGTTSPYKIGTAVTGAYPTSITIGSKTYPIAVSAGENAGEIAWTICEADIDAAGTYGLEGSGEDDLFASISSTGAYIINVNESATLNVASAISLGTITFNVASGKTLTLTGEAITATGGIVVNGSTGIISMTSSALVGAFSGDGVVKYTKVQPRTDASSSVDFTNSAWTGTVWLYDWNYSATQNQALYVSYWCNSGSKLKFTKVKGYLPTSGQLGYDGSTLGELVLEDEGSAAAFNRTDGYSHSSANNYYCAFAKLSGSGTFTDSKSQYIYVVFGDISTFTGTFNLTNNTTIIVDESSPAGTTYDGKLYVAAGKMASVSVGKTWNFVNGVFVNGTVELNGGATIPKVAAASAGSVTVTSGTGTVSGVDASVFPVRITVYPTATLAISDSSVESLTIPAEFTDFTNFTYYNGGTLNLSGCTSLTTLRLDLGSSTSFSLSNVTLPTTCTTIKYVTNLGTGRAVPSYTSPIGLDTRTWQVELSATETKAEYANGSFELTGLPSDTTVVVTRADGTTASATVSDGTAHLSDYGAVKISGAATDIDWDFTDGEDDALEQAPSGVSKNSDSAMTFSIDDTDSTKTGVYIKHHPYITGAASFMGNNSAAMSVAVVGTMPATSNTIFLNVGSAYSQQYGLVFVTTANANEVLIGYNYGGTVTPITTMTVPNSSTARHSYIVTKEDGDSTTTFTVYLDGIKWKTVTTASKITFPSSDSGIQVGADFGSQIRNAGTYIGADDGVGVLNVLRVYGRIITPAEIAVYADTFPYVSPNGASSRTFAAAAEDWVEDVDADWTNTDSEGTVTSGTAPTAGASVTVTASTATEITVNLDSETSYEALTINGSAVTLASGGSGDIKVTGMTVIGAPVTVKYGAADFTGGPMTITEDGSIRFDYSAYDISEIYTTTNITLTSDVEQNDTKVTLKAPTATYQTASLVYTSGHYEMRVTPVHEAGTELYYKSGYFGKNATAGEEFTVVLSDGTTTAPVFPGDIVVIDSKSSQDPIYVGELPDNVAAIRIDRATRLSSGNASIAMLDGATVTVGENGSLTIYRNWNEVHLGNVVFNGTSVSLDQNANGYVTNGQSATLSVSGAVSGTAALTTSGTVNVASGGSIANAVAGTGTIAYAAIPAATPSSFTGWTGTVSLLPSFSASSGVNFNSYGTTGSTVALAGMTDGYILAAGKTVNPTLRLDGNMSITDMSSWTYTFAEITGTGDLSFATSDNQPTAINITKVAEGYSGTISSTLTTPVTIGKRNLSTLPACDDKVLAVGGTGTISLDVSNIKIGVNEESLPAKYKLERRHEGEEGDGFYVYYNGTIFSVY